MGNGASPQNGRFNWYHFFLTGPSPSGTNRVDFYARGHHKTNRDRHPACGSWTETTMDTRPFPLRCAVVGRGRMDAALSAALGTGEPLGHGADCAGAELVLLAVPDDEIAAAAAAVAPGPLVGHLSGATTLAPLQPHEPFSLHPMMPVTGAGTGFAGATAAVAGHPVARRVAELLGMRAVEVADADR